MIRKLNAIYENGTLRPLEPINLQENERVTLFLENADGARGGDLDLQKGDLPSISPESPSTQTRPWRGIFQGNGDKVPIFSCETELRTADLPSWKPLITIDRRWIEHNE